MRCRPPLLKYVLILSYLASPSSATTLPKISVAADGEQRTYGEKDIVFLLVSASNPFHADQQEALSSSEVISDGWVYPFIANVALLAFRESAVLEGPSAWSGYNFHVVHVDMCKHGVASEQCQALDSLKAVDAFALSDTIGPRLKGAAISFTWAKSLAQLLSLRRIPTLGFQAGELSLDDKTEFPYFVRTCPSDELNVKALLGFVHHLNYTQLLLWHGVGSYQVELSTAAAEYGSALGISVGLLWLSGGPNELFPPAEDSQKGIEWRLAVQKALAGGAHVFMCISSSSDPIIELMAWLSLNGLVGPGYLWLFEYVITKWMPTVYGILSQLVPDSPYNRIDFFDGCIMTDDAAGSNPRWEAFHDYVSSLQNRTDDLEPWIVQKIVGNERIWNQGQQDDPPNAYRLFDAFWMLFLATNTLLLERGDGFNNDDVLGKLLDTRINATGGLLDFDDIGGLRGTVTVLQYQPPCADGERIPDTLSSEVVVGSLRHGSEFVMVAEEGLIFHSCATNAPPDTVLDCDAGQYYHSTSGCCVDCAAGTHASFSTQSKRVECSECVPGTYSNTTASVTCTACLSGEFSPDPGATGCTRCQPGYHQERPLQSSCRACSPGAMTDISGASECSPCDIGKYSSVYGASECFSCQDLAAGSTTEQFGSTGPEACLCEAGLYKSDEGHECLSCPPGMACLRGSVGYRMHMNVSTGDPGARHPVILPGFMSFAHSPYEVYRCSQEEHCPGGMPDTCSENRNPSTVACGECKEGSFASAAGACKLCSPLSTVLLVSILTALIALTISATFAVNGDMQSSTSQTFVAMFVLVGLMLTALQVLSVFHRVEIPWGSPLSETLEIASLVSADVSIMRLDCVVGSSPLLNYACLLGLQPFVVFLVALTLFARKCCRVSNRQSLYTELAHTLGTFLSVIFIPVLNSVMEPFICYSHPGDLGSSLRHFPSVLCFAGGTHTSMLTYAFLFIMAVPVPFIALSGLAIIQYPYYMSGGDDSSRFLYATRYLFVKFTADAFYFQAIILVRSLMLCLVPVVLTTAWSQVLAMAVLLSGYALVQQACRPWMAAQCNLYDLVTTLLLLFILLLGTMFLDSAPQRDVMGALGFSCAMAVFLSSALGLVLSVCKSWGRHHLYHFFLCHHKAHAAAQVRYLKMLMEHKRSSLRIFIDSDDLQDLDKLFDVVRLYVKHFVVYLTPNILKRPWCAGEIVTAWRSGHVLTCIETPSFVRPRDLSQLDIEQYLTLEGDTIPYFKKYFIELSDIVEAYLEILEGEDTRRVCMEGAQLGTRPFHQVAGALLMVTVAGAERTPHVNEISSENIIVSTYGSLEADATGGILVSYILTPFYRESDRALYLLADFDKDVHAVVRSVRDAAAVVVVLSEGTMTSEEQLTIICEAMLSHEVGCIPVHTPDFEFPTAGSIEAAFLKVADLLLIYGEQETLGFANSFFRLISVYFPTHASKHALRTQAHEVLHRLLECTRGSSPRRLSCVSVNGSNQSHIGSASQKSPASRGSTCSQTRVSTGSHNEVAERPSVRSVRSVRRTASPQAAAEVVPSHHHSPLPPPPPQWTFKEQDEFVLDTWHGLDAVVASEMPQLMPTHTSEKSWQQVHL